MPFVSVSALMNSCSVDNCDESIKIKGLCAYHYGRKRYKGDYPVHPSKRIRETKLCTVVECNCEVQAASLCMKHYKAFQRWKCENSSLNISEFMVKESQVKKRPPIGTFL